MSGIKYIGAEGENERSIKWQHMYPLLTDNNNKTKQNKTVSIYFMER